MDDIQKLKNKLEAYKKELSRLQEVFESAKCWNYKNNIS